MYDNPTSPDNKRLQFVFSSSAYNELEEMKKEYGAGSFAELVRNALRVYRWFKEREKEGYRIGLISPKEEKAREVELLL